MHFQSSRRPSPWEVTAGNVYLRGHGPTGQYKDRYPAKTLERWAGAIAQWRRNRLLVYCYFDNDQKTAPPKDGERLIDISGRVDSRARLADKRENDSSAGPGQIEWQSSEFLVKTLFFGCPHLRFAQRPGFVLSGTLHRRAV